MWLSLTNLRVGRLTDKRRDHKIVFTLMKVLRTTVDHLKALINGDSRLCAEIVMHVPYVWADLIDDAQISCHIQSLFFTHHIS